MELKGAYKIPAARELVWEKLNDPDVLRESIPGCEELEQNEDGGFSATVKAKVGPVSAKFKGAVTLEDLNPPASYRIVGEGKGGVAGFAKGDTEVTLEDVGDATVLRYVADARIGGKLAQIGSRLIKGTARKMADQFFSNFAQQVAPGADVEKLDEEDD